MEVLLHDDVAPSGKLWVLFPDDRGLHGSLICRILGSVDEPDEIAILEVLKAMDLIDR